MHDVYDDMTLEKILKAQFGVPIEVDSVIGRRFPISRTGTATLFLTDKKQLFLYIENQGKMTLSEVKKIVSRIGLRAEKYLPPKGRPQYFDEVGLLKFREVFPGRSQVSEMDLTYYKTLAPYNPALVSISEVKDGSIYCFDPDSSTGWRSAAKFSYRRIRTS